MNTTSSAISNQFQSKESQRTYKLASTNDGSRQQCRQQAPPSQIHDEQQLQSRYNLYNKLKNSGKQKDSGRLPYSINGNSMKLRNKAPNVKTKMKSTCETTEKMNVQSSGQNTAREYEQVNTNVDELTDEYNGTQFSPIRPSFAPFTYPLRKSRRIKLKISKNNIDAAHLN